MKCKRCDTPIVYVGESEFHEGTRWGALGDFGELAVNKEPFSLYFCRSCGEVSFFSSKFREKLSQDEFRKKVEKIGEVKAHPLFEEFMSEDLARKYLSEKDLATAFVSWVEPKL